MADIAQQAFSLLDNISLAELDRRIDFLEDALAIYNTLRAVKVVSEKIDIPDDYLPKSKQVRTATPVSQTAAAQTQENLNDADLHDGPTKLKITQPKRSKTKYAKYLPGLGTQVHQIWVYLKNCGEARTAKEIGEALNIHYGSISSLMSRYKDWLFYKGEMFLWSAIVDSNSDQMPKAKRPEKEEFKESRSQDCDFSVA